MEYLLLAVVIVWALSLAIGLPLWDKYVNWIIKNFGDKKNG